MSTKFDGLPMWTSPSVCNWRPRPVEDGGEKPCYEQRQEVLDEYLPKLKTEDPIRINYTNGEFTCESLILSKTFKGVKNEKIELEVASRVAFYDPKLELWWRLGGSFD